jgi:hypothetical protein
LDFRADAVYTNLVVFDVATVWAPCDPRRYAVAEHADAVRLASCTVAIICTTDVGILQGYTVAGNAEHVQRTITATQTAVSGR